MYLTKYFPNPISSFFDRDFEKDFFDEETLFTPKANITANDKGYTLSVDLPGVNKKDVSIEVKDNTLTVKGERKEEKKDKKDGYTRYESTYGKFERIWNVENIDTNEIKAEHKDGILSIELPKKQELIEKDEVKKIEVR